MCGHESGSRVKQGDKPLFMSKAGESRASASLWDCSARKLELAEEGGGGEAVHPSVKTPRSEVRSNRSPPPLCSARSDCESIFSRLVLQDARSKEGTRETKEESGSTGIEKEGSRA